MEKQGTYQVGSLDHIKTKPERLIPESQIREVVRSLLLEIQSVPPKAQWYDTTPAYSLLGLDSAETLRIMVRQKMLRLGVEVRDIRLQGSCKPHYQFHIAKCETRLLEPPEKRSAR